MNEADFNRIKLQLDASHDWPALYMFKFIVPSDNEKIAKVEALFNAETAEIRLRPSKNGKYTSITAREIMTSSDAVMECYAQASQIEGLIAL
jgi:putative lipoic acid-binding regulatory protein